MVDLVTQDGTARSKTKDSNVFHFGTQKDRGRSEFPSKYVDQRALKVGTHERRSGRKSVPFWYTSSPAQDETGGS